MTIDLFDARHSRRSVAGGRPPLLRIVALSLASTSLLTSAAFAGDVTWTTPSDSDWFNATNWGGGIAPGSNDKAIINGATSVDVTGQSANVGALAVGTSSSGTPSLTIGPNGSLTFANGVIGEAGGNASVTISGTGASLTQTSEMTIGRDGTGSLTVENGGHLTTRRLGLSTATWEAGTAGSGSLTVTGSGTVWENTAGVDIARKAGSTGSLTVENGATARITGTGIYSGSGAQMTFTGAGTRVEIGDPTDPRNLNNSAAWLSPTAGTITVSNGASLYTSGTYVGSEGGSLASMTVTGAGSSFIGEQRIYVGGQNGSRNEPNDPMNGNGELTISNGATAWGGSVGIGMDPRSRGVATVTGSGSQLWAKANNALAAPTAGNFYVGYAGDGKVVVSDGASVKADNELRIAYGTASSKGRLIIGGETVAAAAGSVTATNGIVFGEGDGEVIFNHTNTDYVFGSSISGSGNVTVNAGSTTLSGTNTYTGSTTINDGTLKVTGSLSGSSIDVRGDGKLVVSDGGSVRTDSNLQIGDSTVGGPSRLIIGGETVAAAAGSVTATNGVVFGPGDGEVIFNHTNSDYVFGSSISGNGSVTVKSGTTTLSGTNTYTRGTDLDGGILNVTGSLSGSNTGVAMSGATLTNSGSIAGNTYGVVFDTIGNTLSSNGRISGSVASVLFGRGGNTLNISQNASFSGVVDYDLSTGNTTSFAAGSYRIPAAHYLDTQNAIALNNSNQMVVLENASSPSGYINVVAVPAASQAATQYSSSVADVIGSILSLDVARPDQVNVGGTTISALQYGEEKPESTEAKAVRVLGDGVAVDGYGNLFWTRSFGGLRYQPAGDKDPASHTSHYGVISGIDHQFENHRLGFFAGGGSVSSNTADNASTMDGVTGFAGIYGAVELGGLQWNASVTAGGIDNKAGRAINNAGTIETAEGNFMGWYVSPEVAVSRAYDIASQWQLTPSLKFRYTGAFYNGYDESGSSQNLSFDERQTHSLDGKLQVELKRKLTLPSGLPASVTASAALVDTQALGSGSTHVSLNNNELTVAGSTDRNVVGASLGFGFDAMISDRAAVYGGIDGTINSDESMSAAGRLGLKLAF